MKKGDGAAPSAKSDKPHYAKLCYKLRAEPEHGKQRRHTINKQGSGEAIAKLIDIISFHKPSKAGMYDIMQVKTVAEESVQL